MKKHNDHMFLLYLPFIACIAASLYYYIRAVLQLGIKEVDKGMSTGELIALIAPVSAALLTGALALWAQVVQFKKDRQRIEGVNETAKTVLANTTDIKPRVMTIEEQSKELYRMALSEFQPSLKQLNKLERIVSHVDRQEALQQQASVTLRGVNELISEIRALYERNATLENENRQLAREVTELKSRQTVKDNRYRF